MTCPFCGQQIDDAAIVCKYCSQFLPLAGRKPTTPQTVPSLESSDLKSPVADATAKPPILDRPLSWWFIRLDGLTLLLIVLAAGVLIYALLRAVAVDPRPSTRAPRAETETRRSTPTEQPRPAPAAESPGALEMMQTVFVGEPTISEIRPQLDRALMLYGNLPRSEENYHRAASTLVALRKNTGISEMRILNYMIRSHVSGVNLTFPEAAALSASFLKVGDK